MRAAVEEFLHGLAEQKDVSPHTIAAYRSDLGQLLGWLAENEVRSWQAVESAHVSGFVGWLRRRGYASSTVARRLAAVKSFFRFMIVQGTVKDDPAEAVEPPPVERPFPPVLSAEEMGRLLDVCEGGDSPKALRDRALLELLCATGVRVSEAIALQVADVRLESGEVRCRGRGKTRTLALPERALHAVQSYLAKARPLLAPRDEPALFVNLRGRSLTRQGLWLLVRECAREAKLEQEVTPHVLRHSFAVQRLDQGDTLEEVQRLLGHANLSTTKVYAELTAELAKGG